MKSSKASNHAFSHNAMGTTFEILISAEEPEYSQQVAWAAVDELDRLEMELSRFIPSSDVCRINALRRGEYTLVGVDTMECLKLAEKVWQETQGAFDITVGQLTQMSRTELSTDKCHGQQRDNQPLAETGMDLLLLDEDAHAVSVKKQGVCVDLGGIGKGYALDQMAKTLDDWSIQSALLHGGQSTVFVVGGEREGRRWEIPLRDPRDGSTTIETALLGQGALSGSGVQLHGRHIIDPRTGKPVANREACWAIAPSAALADALSTSFMVMEEEQISEYCEGHADVCAMIRAGGKKRCWGNWSFAGKA